MQDFRRISVWEKSHAFTLKIYKLSQSFPKEETYGLTSQLRRASTSIPTNIAEGCVKNTNPEYSRFLYISLGSASEVEYLLMLCNDLHMIDENNYKTLSEEIQEIKKMLTCLIKKVKTKN